MTHQSIADGNSPAPGGATRLRRGLARPAKQLHGPAERLPRPAKRLPGPAERLPGKVKLSLHPRQRVGDETRGLVHDGDDVAVGHATRPDHAEYAQHLPAVGVRGGDEAAFPHLLDRVFPADEDLHTALLRHAGQEVHQARLVLEGLEQPAHGADIAEVWVVEHVDGAADIEVAVAQEPDDLIEDAAAPGPERVERIRRPLDVVEDGLEGLAAVAPGQGAAELAQL